MNHNKSIRELFENLMIQNKQTFERWQIIAVYLFLFDLIAVNFSYFFGLWIRFDFIYSKISDIYMTSFMKFAPWYTVFVFLIFWKLKLYNSIWKFASFSELTRISVATIITSLFHVFGITVFVHRMPISYYMIGTLVQFCMVVGVRFSYRFVLLQRKSMQRGQSDGKMKRIMMIGAGAAGQIIIKELRNAQAVNMTLCCIIDDDKNKWNRFIDGVPIVGGRDDILSNVEKFQIDQILYAIPSLNAAEKRDILSICNETGCELKSLPGVYQLVNGDVSLSKMKEVAVEDLLGRDPIKVNMGEIFQYIKGKTILVTGGGGSIGSELCRQIAEHGPKHLIIFEIYENSAYDIEQELKRKYPKLTLSVLIGSVRDSKRVQWVFEQYQPEIVYHAAAHKHVPLMETSPCEAIKNNVMGTYKTAYAALKNGCERFVLISTDKAVNPTNIMGASKRLCEMVVQSMNVVSTQGRYDWLPFVQGHINRSFGTTVLHDPENMLEHDKFSGRKNKGKPTEFVAVRFGNVLGSNGSVIPLFRKQIEQGGPVTVTHPDIIRYFMTISEAVSLVLQAGTYAKGGEIFVLDMGEAMKIDTLARNLVKLSGFKPDRDIEIVYTGLRPGEKLFEEKLMEEEGLLTTPNKLIHIGKPIPFDVEEFFGELEGLAEASYDNYGNIVEVVADMVPTFHSELVDVRSGRDVEKAVDVKVVEDESALVAEIA